MVISVDLLAIYMRWVWGHAENVKRLFVTGFHLVVTHNSVKYALYMSLESYNILLLLLQNKNLLVCIITIYY